MTAGHLTTGMRARCMVDRITTARPVVALSTYRKLRRDHPGGAYSLRRSSDSVSRVIPHRGRLVHTSAAQDFIGGVDGLCAQWTDQSGNSNDLFGTPAGVQPALILAGTLQTYTTVPVFKFDGSNDQVGRTDKLGLSGNVTLTLAMVCKINTTAAYYCMWMMGTTGANHFAFNANNLNQLNVGASGGYTYTGQTLATVHRYVATHTAPNNNTDYTLSVDGVTQSGSTFGSPTAFLNIGGSNGSALGAESGLSFCAAMSCSFFAMWNAALTADEHSILQEEMLLHAA